MLPITIVSTPSSALADPFNWFMIVPFAIWAAVIGFQLAHSFQWIGIILLIIPISILYVYVNVILNREFEINEYGIRYREWFRNLTLSWEEIDAILIEPFLGQITFGTDNQVKRIHEFGLPKRQRKEAREILIQEAKVRGIRIV